MATKQENNLEIYNKLKEVPEEAQKKITGGRLNGMTDIKPMWRIEKLTETFGMAGIGWYTETTKKEIIEGANGEKIATVDILLYVKIGDEWTKGIEGSGGSSFISNEKNGYYTSDECFKMAYTDALSVACKSLGMGANVYWGDSKYTTKKSEPTKEDAIEYVFTFGKKKGELLTEVIKDTGYMSWLMNNTKDEYLLKCIELLTGEVKKTDEEIDELTVLQQKLMSYELKGENLDIIKDVYKVKSISDMSKANLEQALRRMKEKWGE